ncbi:hypothetical protein AMTR_s00074p00108300 [Amborella trichopoda]|uniref:Uncharacterized protein n=1 Tax=Amborella trichopoda TaxID=13333 RepID=W1NM16_AMBTC|nr:hypothetical protein AMTR_s00074p00108300 [Amborella trichopoda]
MKEKSHHLPCFPKNQSPIITQVERIPKEEKPVDPLPQTLVVTYTPDNKKILHLPISFLKTDAAQRAQTKEIPRQRFLHTSIPYKEEGDSHLTSQTRYTHYYPPTLQIPKAFPPILQIPKVFQTQNDNHYFETPYQKVLKIPRFCQSKSCLGRKIRLTTLTQPVINTIHKGY